MEPMPTAVDTAPTLADDPALGLDRRTKFEILGAVLLGLFLVALDQTIVGTALPRIVTDLKGNDLYTWVVTIYLLTSTITVPFYGKLSDIYGRRPMLMIGITLFLVGSALSGLSQEMWQLVLFRGIQGLGAGAMFPIALAVIGDLFSPAERGRYQGLFGAVFGISFLIGPALGGFLTDTISWHWIFYVNIPIGIVSLFVIWRLLPNIKHSEIRHSLDYIGAAVFTVAISLLLIGLTNKQTGEWTDATVGGLILAGVIGSLIFVAIESRAVEPIVPLELWRNRTYAASMLSTFFVSFGFFGAIIFLPRWFQVVLGSSATESGYQLFPLLIGLIGSSIVSGIVISRTGKYRMLIVGALVIMTVGLGLMSQITADTELHVLWLWMFITGVGIGPTLSAFTIVVQNAVPFSKLGVATSNLTFFRQIGGSIGLAIAGTVFGTALEDRLPGQVTPVFEELRASIPPPFQAQFDQFAQAPTSGAGLDLNDLAGVGQSFGQAINDLIAASVPPEAKSIVEGLLAPIIPKLDHAFFEAFSLAMGQTMLVGVGTGVLAVLFGLLMRELPLRTTTGPGVPAGASNEAVGARVAPPVALD